MESGPSDRRSLDERGEEALVSASSGLVTFATASEHAAIVHERDGQSVGAWDRAGALRLAQLLPPAFADLSNAILERHQSNATRQSEREA